ncbi:hypothetical protein AsAng_0043260 [Aureispira anguillae]|uniref:Uncharacterized protein n=1 Tax=Aureispira anguillae TaxID=2864201 RepID=A0A916DVC7_9BACT|nr:hypothetical protein AsAng_0043260 [Aureispira anguillae]
MRGAALGVAPFFVGDDLLFLGPKNKTICLLFCMFDL